MGMLICYRDRDTGNKPLENAQNDEIKAEETKAVEEAIEEEKAPKKANKSVTRAKKPTTKKTTKK